MIKCLNSWNHEIYDINTSLIFKPIFTWPGSFMFSHNQQNKRVAIVTYPLSHSSLVGPFCISSINFLFHTSAHTSRYNPTNQANSFGGLLGCNQAMSCESTLNVGLLFVLVCFCLSCFCARERVKKNIQTHKNAFACIYSIVSRVCSLKTDRTRAYPVSSGSANLEIA